MTQQDDITQRLRDNADLDEAEHGNARVVQLEREAADEIERLRAELSKLRAPVADERTAFESIMADPLQALLGPGPASMRLFSKGVYDSDYVQSAWLSWQARAALASAPVAQILTPTNADLDAAFSKARIAAVAMEASAPVAGEAQPDRFKPPFENCSFRMCDLPGQCRGEGKCHHPANAAPQASAEDVRNAALEEAAKLMDQTLRSNGAALIRGLKRSQAAKDGGQQRAGDGKEPQ